MRIEYDTGGIAMRPFDSYSLRGGKHLTALVAAVNRLGLPIFGPGGLKPDWLENENQVFRVESASRSSAIARCSA